MTKLEDLTVVIDMDFGKAVCTGNIPNRDGIFKLL